jgi:hypothetical protein
VIGKVSDVDWQQLIVLAKPIAKLISGADEIVKPLKQARISGVESP